MKKLGILLFVTLAWVACDPCSDTDCGLHGTCEEGDCVCDEGWTGDNCDVDMCASVNCVHGDCVAGACVCDDGWGGTLCNDCDTDCGANGECNDAGTCDCDAGWTGELCDQKCSNTCIYANDGDCDDGGPGSDYNYCACGSDCGDCGPRTAAACEGVVLDGAISVYSTMAENPCNTNQIDVYINVDEDDYPYSSSDLDGIIDSYYNFQPDCGDNGTVTEDLAPGTYYFYAECNDGDFYWDGNVPVTAGICSLVPLSLDKSLKIIRKPFVRRK